MNILSSKTLDIPKKKSFSSINILSKKFSINCKSTPNKYYESTQYRLSQKPPIYFYRKITNPYKYNITKVDLSYSNRKSNEDIFAEKVKDIINKEIGDSRNLNDMLTQSLKKDKYKPKGYPYFDFVYKHHNILKNFFPNEKINKNNLKEKNIVNDENEKNIMNNSSKYIMKNHNGKENNKENLNNIQYEEVNNNNVIQNILEKEKIKNNFNEKNQKDKNDNEVNKYENNHNINYNENIKNDNINNKNEYEYNIVQKKNTIDNDLNKLLNKKEDISQLNHSNNLQDRYKNNTIYNPKTIKFTSNLYPKLSEIDEIKYKYYESDPHNLKNDNLFKNKSGEKYLFRNNYQLKDFENKLHISSESNSSWIPKIPKRITYNNLSSVKYNIISPLKRSIFKTREEITGLKIANRVKSVSEIVNFITNKSKNSSDLFENSIKDKKWFMKRNQVAANQADLHHAYKEIIPHPFS